MRSALSAQLRPADFTRGRLAAVVCGIYLLGVLVAGAVLSMLFPDGAAEGPGMVLIVAQSFLIALVHLRGWLILRGPRHAPRTARPPGGPETA